MSATGLGRGRGAPWLLVAGLVVLGVLLTVVNNPDPPAHWWLAQAWSQWVSREPVAAGTVGILIFIGAIALSLAVEDARKSRRPSPRGRPKGISPRPTLPPVHIDPDGLRAEARRLARQGAEARAARDLPTAKRCLGEAAAALRAASREHPSEDLSRELAEACGRYGSLAGLLGDRAAELSALREAAAIERDLIGRAPPQGGARTRLARACMRLGSAERSGGDPAAAQRAFTEALEQLNRLGESGTAGPALKADLLFTLKGLGDVAEARGDRDAALAWHQRSLPLAEDLAAREGAGARAFIDLAYARRRVAELR